MKDYTDVIFQGTLAYLEDGLPYLDEAQRRKLLEALIQELKKKLEKCS